MLRIRDLATTTSCTSTPAATHLWGTGVGHSPLGATISYGDRGALLREVCTVVRFVNTNKDALPEGGWVYGSRFMDDMSPSARRALAAAVDRRMMVSRQRTVTGRELSWEAERSSE